MTSLALIRHAHTEWNAQGRIQGQSDSPLTSQGRAWAKQCARTLGVGEFQAVYASPLGRAMATAGIIGEKLGLAVSPQPGLMEQAFGAWEGKTVQELRESGLLQPQMALGWAFEPPGGESRQALLARVWESLLALGRGHPRGKVLVVAHEGVLRAVCYALLGRDYLPGEPKVLEPRTLHWLRADGVCLRIEALNQPL